MAVRKYGKINLDKERNLWLIDGAEPHICIKLKAIFNKVAVWDVQPFQFTNTPENCHDLIWFMERYPLSINSEDFSLMQNGKKNHIDTINEMESILLQEYIPKKVLLKDGLKGRNYQLVGKDLYIKAKRLLIGDDIGLGKTLVGILSFFESGTLPAFVVVQKHLTKQWKDEIERFTNLKVHVIKTRKVYSLPPADVYVIRYSCLSGWTDIFQTGMAKSAIFDEIQELRHNGTDKYNSAKVLAGSVIYCLGLSASPVYNYGSEIFNVLSIIKAGCLGSRDEFMREWTDGWKIVEDPKALGTYLREQILFLRRTRKDVGMELPPVNTIVHTVDYDEHEVAKAEDMAKMLALKVMTGSFVERGQASRDLDILVRHATGVSKAKYVAEYLKILLDNNEPIIVGAWHREVWDILLHELSAYNPVMYTGTESDVQKEKSKQAFINGETNCFFISLRSGIGLDGLQERCKLVVIAELDYSPKVHEQLIGRSDRPRKDGEEQQVTAIYLVSDYGSDPVIIDLLGLKSSQSHGIIDPLTAVANQYSDESRIKLLAKKYLDKKEYNP